MIHFFFFSIWFVDDALIDFLTIFELLELGQLSKEDFLKKILVYLCELELCGLKITDQIILIVTLFSKFEVMHILVP